MLRGPDAEDCPSSPPMGSCHGSAVTILVPIRYTMKTKSSGRLMLSVFRFADPWGSAVDPLAAGFNL